MATKTVYDTIPALPATYAGIKFRSRTEAKWAYYFDLCGLPWKYEPEGYALKAGNYVPDFRCYDFFVEVKPTEVEMDKHSAKFAELSKVTKESVFCVVGEPSTKRQKHWKNGEESDTGVFSRYAFGCKGWTFPNIGEGPEDAIDEGWVWRANRLQFNRAGVAEVDWESIRALNEVIRRRREVHKEWNSKTGPDWAEFFKSKIEPLNHRIASLETIAFPPYSTWAAA